MATIPSWVLLVRGDSGKNVRALQCLLNYRNNNKALTVDGSFGPSVYNAVVAFQRSNGLTADGQAGVNTISKLVAVVQQSSSNEAARAAQYLLSKFEPVSIDGIFGAGSVKATKTFQDRMGLRIDGVVDTNVWRYLFGYLDYTLHGQDYWGCEILITAQKTLLKENKPFYQAAERTYGVPWEMLAAIHYRETKLRRGSPNSNGPYQIVKYTYPVGDYTDTQFQNATNDAADYILKKAAEANLSVEDLYDADSVKKVFFYYNGSASVYVKQGENLGYSSAEAQNGEGSPYVMNRANAKRDPTVEPAKSGKTWGQIKSDYSGIVYPANNDYGAFIIYELLH